MICARSNANEHAIDPAEKKIGAGLLEYVFEPLLKA